MIEIYGKHRKPYFSQNKIFFVFSDYLVATLSVSLWFLEFRIRHLG